MINELQMEDQKMPSIETTSFDSPSEREKWEFEKAFRYREIAIKEREQTYREAELKLKADEQKSSTWRNPVFVALIGALAAAGGNALISLNNGIAQRSLEKERSEQTRILEMIKTGDPDKAAENLKFLLSAGLISDLSLKDSLRIFLAQREAGSGPALAAPVGGIVGIDDAKPAATLKDALVQKVSKVVGRLEILEKSGQIVQMGTAVLVAENLILTAAHVINENKTSQLRMDSSGKVYKVILPAIEKVSTEKAKDMGLMGGYALYRVENKPGSTFGYLPLTSTPPVIGEPLLFVFFRGGGPQQLAVANTVDCQVKSIAKQYFTHLCDSGPGSSGGVLISAITGQVVGIHVGSDPQKGKVAIRTDMIKKLSKAL